MNNVKLFPEIDQICIRYLADCEYLSIANCELYFDELFLISIHNTREWIQERTKS